MAGERVAGTSGSPLTDIATALGVVAGTRKKETTTTSPGDVKALEDVLAQLKGTDYTAMLDSIMQRAGTAIPGMQATYGRAAGFRGSNNAGLAGAMQQLLKDTTLAAQEKIAAQQLQNQQLQTQAGQSIAQATKGTTQTTSGKTGMDLNKAIALLALAQGVSKLSGSNMGKQFSNMFTTPAGASSAAGTAAAAIPTVAPATPMAAPAAAMVDATGAPMTPTPSWQMRDLVTAATNPIMGFNNMLGGLTSAGTAPPIVSETSAPTGGFGQGLVDFVQRQFFGGSPVELSPMSNVVSPDSMFANRYLFGEP